MRAFCRKKCLRIFALSCARIGDMLLYCQKRMPGIVPGLRDDRFERRRPFRCIRDLCLKKLFCLCC